MRSLCAILIAERDPDGTYARLGRSISQVAAQSELPDQVVVITDHADAMNEAPATERLQNVSMMIHGPGVAVAERYAMAHRVAVTDWIVFFHADAEYGPDYLKNLYAALERRRQPAAMCGVHVLTQSPRTGQYARPRRVFGPVMAYHRSLVDLTGAKWIGGEPGQVSVPEAMFRVLRSLQMNQTFMLPFCGSRDVVWRPAEAIDDLTIWTDGPQDGELTEHARCAPSVEAPQFLDVSEWYRSLSRLEICSRCPHQTHDHRGLIDRLGCDLLPPTRPLVMHCATAWNACPAGQWQAETKPPPDRPAPKVKRERPVPKPVPAPVPPKKISEKMLTFLRAVTGPAASDETYQNRLATCTGCEHLKTVVRGDEQRLFCGACGCGKWRLAELHTKLKFADLECPLDPPKWVRETPDAG